MTQRVVWVIEVEEYGDMWRAWFRRTGLPKSSLEYLCAATEELVERQAWEKAKAELYVLRVQHRMNIRKQQGRWL